MSSSSRTSQARILERLRLASRKGDRAALALALDEMRTLAFTPRYWLKYMTLVQNPLARLVDLLVIKQGDRIAHQRGWKPPPRKRAPSKKAVTPASPAPGPPPRGRRARATPDQPSLF